MKKAIEVRVKRINKTNPALYVITSVFGLMDTFEHPYVTTRQKAQYHLDTLIAPKKSNIPIIWE